MTFNKQKLSFLLNILVILFSSLPAPHIFRETNNLLEKFTLKESAILYFASFSMVFLPCSLLKILRWNIVDLSMPSLFKFSFNPSSRHPNQLSFIFSLMMICSSLSCFLSNYLNHFFKDFFVDTKFYWLFFFLIGSGLLTGSFAVSVVFNSLDVTSKKWQGDNEKEIKLTDLMLLLVNAIQLMEKDSLIFHHFICTRLLFLSI